jgi:hypothetical protein
MAVFNNGFPATYQPMYYPQQYQPQFQQQQPIQQQTTPAQSSGIIWVQGEAAARSYLMAPNTTLPLWDSETNTIFLKTTDAAGMPSMKVLNSVVCIWFSSARRASKRSLNTVTKISIRNYPKKRLPDE